MRIAVTSRIYFPSTGGVPVYARLLTREWMRMGNEVRLLTSTPNMDGEEDLFPVMRQPTLRDLMATAAWADVLFQVEVSLKFLLPFVLRRKPFVVSHHTHFAGVKTVPFFRRVQGVAANLGTAVSVSEPIRKSWGGFGEVIANPYDHQVFQTGNELRNGELLFVGRLVAEKGIDVLIKALQLLHTHDLRPTLRVIGDAEEQGQSLIPRWQQLSRDLAVDKQVTFLGNEDSAAVAQAMRQSRVLVVPSTWHEPFGIVALEGLASGCRVVASSGGGLPDAGGRFAIYFQNGDAAGLARAIRQALMESPPPDPIWENELAEHLRKHSAEVVAARYLQLFQSIVR